MPESTTLTLFDPEPAPTGKRCPRCEMWKPFADFNRNRTTRDGFQAYCSPCGAASKREWRNANPDAATARVAKVREYRRTLSREEREARNPPAVGMKRCRRCRREKPRIEFEFHRAGRDRRTHFCTECTKARLDEQRAAKAAYNAAYQTGRREQMRQYQRERRYKLYGISQAGYDEMFARQGGLCAICGGAGRPTSDNRPPLVVDHDHSTNQVRALLCEPCNRMLGCAYDDPARLVAAAEYLRVHASAG